MLRQSAADTINNNVGSLVEKRPGKYRDDSFSLALKHNGELLADVGKHWPVCELAGKTRGSIYRVTSFLRSSNMQDFSHILREMFCVLAV